MHHSEKVAFNIDVFDHSNVRHACNGISFPHTLQLPPDHRRDRGIMEELSDFSSLQASVSSALVSSTRTASQLANEDLAFHRSLDASLGGDLDRQNARLLGLAERLLGAATANTEIVRPPRLSDIEAVEGNWRAVVDVVDSLLERADTALDEFTGAVKRLSPGVAESMSKAPKVSRIAAALRSQDIEKPQLQFEHVPTNDETDPFKPLLLSKPHALQPLEASSGAHPYQTEIEHYQYPAFVRTRAEPIMYHPFDSTTATFVDTEEAVHEMLEELKHAKEIAVDLEHHDQRSYIGIVSLMQISTRDKDWIVDTLKPWRRKLHCLNEVFTDSNIIKVLHGAYMDIVWLQRDLGLYIVGLFDTHYAARALGYAGGSLAFLLKKFADVDAQKQYQLADWRIRPLPQELFDYARSDTHYLLYIFDNMRNELLERSDTSASDSSRDRIAEVLQKSSETALQRYEHPIYDEKHGQGQNGWYKMLARTPALFTKEQFSVFRAVHRWRDDVARAQDDGIPYVMPNHQVFGIAKALPTNKADLLGVAQPTTQTVRLRVDELAAVIARAREDGKDGPEMMQVLNEVEPQFPRRTPKGETSHPAAAVTPNHNIGGTANAITSSTLPLRSTRSSFWGSAFKNTADTSRPLSTVNNISLTVPLPPLTAEVFADAAEATSTPTRPPTSEYSELTPVETPAEPEDDTFILKQLGKKRKRVEPIDGMAAQSDEVAIPDDENEHLREKAERKKAKKEAKRAARQAAAEADDGPSATADAEAPFDYTNAPSILHPPRESRESMRDRRKKEVNPYAKSLDAPKGLPRAQKERAGRSMTYQS